MRNVVASQNNFENIDMGPWSIRLLSSFFSNLQSNMHWLDLKLKILNPGRPCRRRPAAALMMIVGVRLDTLSAAASGFAAGHMLKVVPHWPDEERKVETRKEMGLCCLGGNALGKPRFAFKILPNLHIDHVLVSRWWGILLGPLNWTTHESWSPFSNLSFKIIWYKISSHNESWIRESIDSSYCYGLCSNS